MLYVRVSVDFQYDGRLLAAGPMAELLYLRALAWSKKEQQDGRLPAAALPMVALGLGDTGPLVAALVREGLWEETGDGWSVPQTKWAKWQTTAAEVQELARKRAEAGKKGADARWGANQQVNGSGMASAMAEPCDLTRRPTDLQTSLTPLVQPSGSHDGPFAGEFSEVWTHYPRRKDRKAALAAYRARRREGISAERLLEATKRYASAMAGKEQEFVMLGKTFFGPNERWVDYEHDEGDPSGLGWTER